MKKKQKINKAVNHGERLLLGLTALFLCLLFVLRERPAPARGISVRTSAARVPDAAPASVPDAPPDAADRPDSDTPSDSDGASGGPDAAAPESVPVPDSDAPSESDTPSDDSDGDGGRVNLNTADASELRALPGVGDALAARIIDYRETHGPFARPEDVMRVAGIGEGKFAAMQGLITV